MDIELKDFYDELVVAQKLLASENEEKPRKIIAKSENSEIRLIFNSKDKPTHLIFSTYIDNDFSKETIDELFSEFGIPKVILGLDFSDYNRNYCQSIYFNMENNSPNIYLTSYGLPLKSPMDNFVKDILTQLNLSYTEKSGIITIKTYNPDISLPTPGEIITVSRNLQSTYPQLETTLTSYGDHHIIELSTEERYNCPQNKEHLKIAAVYQAIEDVPLGYEDIIGTLEQISSYGIPMGLDWQIIDDLEEEKETYGES